MAKVTLGVAQAVGLAHERGVWVADVDKGGPAERGGLKPGDVITKIAGQEVRDDQAMIDIQEKLPAREGLAMEIVRAGTRQRLIIRPDEITEGRAQYYKGLRHYRGWNVT